jgi:hypothetical protein
MNYYPPKVDYKKKRRLNTVLAFLRSKGWSVERQTPKFAIVKPPEETRAEKDGGFRYWVPANEGASDYDHAAFLMVEVFSEIFDMPVQELFDLFSKSLEDIRVEVDSIPPRIEMKRAMLAHAS